MVRRTGFGGTGTRLMYSSCADVSGRSVQCFVVKQERLRVNVEAERLGVRVASRDII